MKNMCIWKTISGAILLSIKSNGSVLMHREQGGFGMYLYLAVSMFVFEGIVHLFTKRVK